MLAFAILGGQALANGRSNQAALPDPDEFVSQCESKQASGGNIEIGRVTSPEEAKGLPTSPEEAAKRILGGVLFDDYRAPQLGASDTVVVPGGDEEHNTATRYAVVDGDELVGIIIVEEIGYGAYGPTYVDRCSL